MKGFSGFGGNAKKSPAKAADESLLEASKMGSDQVAETTRQMGRNLADMVSSISVEKEEKSNKKKKGNNNSPTTFKTSGKDNLKGHSTKKRAKMGRANKMLKRLGMEGLKPKDLQPLKNKTIPKIDMTLNDALNKAVRKSARKEFLRKNTIKPKPIKPLSRPFGPGTRPLARNVSRGLRAFGRFTGVVGGAMALAPHVVKGMKAVMPGLKKRAKQEFKGRRSIYSSPKI